MTDTNISEPQAQPIYIVTGATDSMGSLITRRLAEQGKPVLLACRNVEKAERYAQSLRASTGNRDLQAMQLVLSSFDQVKDFIERFKTLNRPIAALVNNASTLPRHSKI